MKVGLLCNPLSGRLRKQKIPAPRQFARDCRASYLEASEPEAIAAALDRLLAERPGLLAIAGGDGTVQAALTHLFTAHQGVTWPLLTVIPAGTTNMTALDLGLRGSPRRVLRRLSRGLGQSAPEPVRRRVLRIARPGHPDLYGMFFGAGAIAGGVRYFHERIGRLGMTGELAGGTAMLRLLASVLLARRHPALAPVNLSLTEPGDQRRSGAYLLVLASALDRLLLGLRPYWGTESGPVHVTLVEEAPPRFLRSLLPVLFGRGRRLATDGYASFNTGLLEMRMHGDFIIDGELYRAASTDGPLTISAAGPVSFFVP